MKKFTSEKLSVIESFIFSIVKSYEIFFASPTYVKYKFAKYSCSIMISQNQYILLFVDDVDSYTVVLDIGDNVVLVFTWQPIGYLGQKSSKIYPHSSIVVYYMCKCSYIYQNRMVGQCLFCINIYFAMLYITI